MERRVIDYSELTVGKELGRGSSGVVFLAEFRGIKVALKELLVTLEDHTSVHSEGSEERGDGQLSSTGMRMLDDKGEVDPRVQKLTQTVTQARMRQGSSRGIFSQLARNSAEKEKQQQRKLEIQVCVGLVS